MSGYRKPGDIPLNRQAERAGGGIPNRRIRAGVAASTDYGQGRKCRDCQGWLSRYNPDDICNSCFTNIAISDRPHLRNDI